MKNDMPKRWQQTSFASNIVFQPVAYEMGLTYNDTAMLSWVHALKRSKKAKIFKYEGISYVWVHYPTFLRRYPLMGVGNLKTVSRIVCKLEARGILQRYSMYTQQYRTMIFLSIPDELDEVLFTKDYSSAHINEMFHKWEKYRKAHEIELPVRVEEDSTDMSEVDGSICIGEEDEVAPDPLFDAQEAKTEKVRKLSPSFLAFWEKAKQVSGLPSTTMTKDGVPSKSALFAQDMWYAMKDGTFAQRFHPVSKKYDFSKLGKLTDEDILSTLEVVPDHIKKLNDAFLLFQTKRSYVMEWLALRRLEHKEVPKPKAVAEKPEQPSVPEMSLAEIKADPEIQLILHYIDTTCRKYTMPDSIVRKIPEIRQWYDAHYKDLVEHDLKYRCAVGKRPLLKMAQFLAQYIDRHAFPKLSDMNVDSRWWKGFAVYFYDAFGTKILLDDGVFRRRDEYLNARERLEEPRSYEYDDFT